MFSICKSEKNWNISNIVQNTRNDIKNKLNNKKAIIGLSGGVDSSTAAILVSKEIGKNLTAVYVDTGLMRHKETEFVKEIFSQYKINLKIINAEDRFFTALKGITDP